VTFRIELFVDVSTSAGVEIVLECGTSTQPSSK
jgi:hypothetical protein